MNRTPLCGGVRFIDPYIASALSFANQTHADHPQCEPWSDVARRKFFLPKQAMFKMAALWHRSLSVRSRILVRHNTYLRS